jgi:hypothetical protein
MARTLLLAALGMFCAPIFAQVRQLTLTPVGEPRPLPVRILGLSPEPFWDDLIHDPAKLAAVKSLHPAYTRFPGGSQTNYYDWKRGLFFVPPGPNHSPYYNRFVTLAQYVQRTHPEGISLEDYETFCSRAGAEVILEPNLETASVADQVEWFRRLAAKGAVPSHIEMGNEFWIAMGQDPAVLSRWPDEPTSMQITKRYLDALRPYFPKGAKVAVQAAVPSFRGGPKHENETYDRLMQWNEHLHAEPWFDAVTAHLYPRLNEVLGPGTAKQPVTPAIAIRNLRALMARADEGAETALRDVAARVPGKEIWVTEFNPHGGLAFDSGDSERVAPTTPAMHAQLVTRMILAFLRNPQVTVIQFFSIRFARGNNPKTTFVAGAGGYQPLPVAVALRWLNEAGNGGATFQRFTEANAPRIPGGAWRQEGFGAVEAAVFRGGGHTTMILQNVSADARVWKTGAALKLGVPARVERLDLSGLADPTLAPARIDSVPPSADIAVPPYSITRLIWNSPKETN